MSPGGFEYFSPLVAALSPFELIQPDIAGHGDEESLDAGIAPKFTFADQVDERDDRFLENVLPVLQAAAHRHHVEADQLRILFVDVKNYFVQVVGKNTGYNSVVGEVHSR